MAYNNVQLNSLQISDEKDPLIGTIWDLKYLIESFNKQDTTGKFYIVKNTHTNEPLILKIFNPDLFSVNAKASEQFLLKAEKAITVSHANIIQTKDFGIASIPEVKETETINRLVPYVVTEFLESFTLRELLNNKCVGLEHVLQVLRPICNALYHIHHIENFVHSWLSTDSIVFEYFPDKETYGRTLVSLEPKFLEPHWFSYNEISSKEILRRTFNEPVACMSPEKAEGNSVSPCTDIYSLGAIIYHFLTGEEVFRATTLTVTLLKQLYALPKPIQKINPNISLQLELVVLKALEKTPKKRQQNISELLQDLEQALT